jgi:DNA-binding LacI/PurR family transcriptional regulator
MTLPGRRPTASHKKATIRDVAGKAGVSIATVSFVLNNHPGEVISEKVKKRVLRVARQLDYHASAAAAGLARKRTHNVGVVVHDPNMLANAFYAEVLEGIISETMERNYNVMFSYVSAPYKNAEGLPKMVREKNTEGLLFLRDSAPRMVKDIEARGIKVVLVDASPAIRSAHSIQSDSWRGGELAAEHLFGLGHRRVALVSGPLERPTVRARVDGFFGKWTELGVKLDPKKSLLVPKIGDYEGACESVRKHLEANPDVTALFCTNEEIASGALRALGLLGLEVPRDVSVVGFDDTVIARCTDPPLTTIQVPKNLLGRRAVAMLIDLVENRPPADKTVHVGVELLERSSTAPVATRVRKQSGSRR